MRDARRRHRRSLVGVRIKGPLPRDPFTPLFSSSKGNFDIDVRAPRRLSLTRIEGFGARSGNLWRAEVRAAGSCFRFNTLNVRTARLMHYEGTSVRALRKISVLVEKEEVFQSKACKLIFLTEFFSTPKRIKKFYHIELNSNYNTL